MAETRRDANGRIRDHQAIDRLADDLLPKLIGRLGASGLGEIEVREDGWRVRLRRPADRRIRDDGREARRERGDRSERQSRPSAAHHALTDVRAGDRERTAAPAVRPTGGGGGGNGTGPVTVAGAVARRELVATSPAVGIFQPRADVRAGTRVRSGDRLAVVDLLGVPQDVVAPEDGVVIRALVGPGDGVEYGQDLILLEPVQSLRAGTSEAVFDEEPGT